MHDGDGGDDRITVNIRVTGVPEAPTVTGDTTIQVAENSRGRLAKYSATDPEGLDVTWGLSGVGAAIRRVVPDRDRDRDRALR